MRVTLPRATTTHWPTPNSQATVALWAHCSLDTLLFLPSQGCPPPCSGWNFHCSCSSTGMRPPLSGAKEEHPALPFSSLLQQSWAEPSHLNLAPLKPFPTSLRTTENPQEQMKYFHGKLLWSAPFSVSVLVSNRDSGKTHHPPPQESLQIGPPRRRQIHSSFQVSVTQKGLTCFVQFSLWHQAVCGLHSHQPPEESNRQVCFIGVSQTGYRKLSLWKMRVGQHHYMAYAPTQCRWFSRKVLPNSDFSTSQEILLSCLILEFSFQYSMRVVAEVLSLHALSTASWTAQEVP